MYRSSDPVPTTDISKEMMILHAATVGKNNMRIKKVIFNKPATVVLWEDGTKTIVNSGEEDVYDPEKGLAMAIAKKALGNKGNYYEVFKKWLPKEEDEVKQTLNEIGKGKVFMLTPEKLSEKLGCSVATIRKRCRQGLYPGAKKSGGKWLIPYTLM